MFNFFFGKYENFELNIIPDGAKALISKPEQQRNEVEKLAATSLIPTTM